MGFFGQLNHGQKCIWLLQAHSFTDAQLWAVYSPAAAAKTSRGVLHQLLLLHFCTCFVSLCSLLNMVPEIINSLIYFTLKSIFTKSFKRKRSLFCTLFQNQPHILSKWCRSFWFHAHIGKIHMQFETPSQRMWECSKASSFCHKGVIVLFDLFCSIYWDDIWVFSSVPPQSFPKPPGQTTQLLDSNRNVQIPRFS